MIDLYTAGWTNAYDPAVEDGFGVWTWVGPSADSQFGREVAQAQDMTGDGLAELVIASPVTGQVYLIRSDDLGTMPYASYINDTYHWRLESSIPIGASTRL